ARATMFTTGSGLADGARPGAGPAPRRAPESGAAPPAIEAKARTVAEGGWQLGLGNRNEAGADPDPIEPLGSREHGVDLIALRQECGDEMIGDVERQLGWRIRRNHDHGAVEHGRLASALSEERAAESVPVPRPPAARHSLDGGRPCPSKAEQ